MQETSARMPTRYIAGKSFDPEASELMRQAFEAAWESLNAAGSVDAMPFRAEWARETLALRIIDFAQTGERDVDTLRDDALAHLARSKMQKKA